MTPKIILSIVIAIFITGFLFLGAQLCIVYGVIKERETKNCIKGSELQMWENTLKTAQAICVDVQQNQLVAIKENYESRVRLAEAEAKKWKGYYLFLKKQNEEPNKGEDD